MKHRAVSLRQLSFLFYYCAVLLSFDKLRLTNDYDNEIDDDDDDDE